jgi:hypothetical protein
MQSEQIRLSGDGSTSNVYYWPYRHLPLVPNLSQLNHIHMVRLPTSLWPILILTCHLSLGLTNGLLIFRFLHAFLISPTHATCKGHHIIPNWVAIICGKGYKLRSTSLHVSSFLQSLQYFLFLWSKYSPQHHDLKSCQSVFLPSSQTPNLIPT